ncbi:hypothetical protein Pmar_PMAR019349 [Perkinsus marinus ATCC 50983]|uniref:Uncharacterized protein n=1 Tax=Perkinsus marinus (strain ATCC 50983 / TXsc) TaxID=423536 RepID=C5L810_PERM5|nr:hypothetical protein Pmar_PMAR019349 [Perkinsus marinus ATCC 50983]EER07133.1 hypothetical protein Pmar_PMAR019349 [Perkinsus marinus ATCC 50983]|eukprot:XP_002775317.1 hypothetical protein Pmar_PMAR019349 [Perkinsus marinus ATCC 50983]
MPVDEAPVSEAVTDHGRVPLQVLDKAQVSRVPASSDGSLTVELFTTPAGVVLRLAVPMGVIMKVIMTAEGLFGPDGHVVKPEPPAKRIEVNPTF